MQPPASGSAATRGAGDGAAGRARCANARGGEPNARRAHAGHGEARANGRAGAELGTAGDEAVGDARAEDR